MRRTGVRVGWGGAGGVHPIAGEVGEPFDLTKTGCGKRAGSRLLYPAFVQC